MYTRQEASAIKREFWTNFGLYLKPVPGAEGEKLNWLNYKTGIRNLYFRMDVDNTRAVISIDIRSSSAEERMEIFEKFKAMKVILEESMGESWDWTPTATGEEGQEYARIGTVLTGVNVFTRSDWPAIISFLKPRLIALDKFWSLAKYTFM